ncbi:MAG: hypothetical protein KTR32_18350, partial [Granulosicoccus sp.]|nr:hypothetical protein [Granulosicoccus sp.]
LVVKPFTEQFQTALYARIPPEARSTPDVFVSHAWGHPMAVHPGTTLTDMAAGNRAVSRAAFCWIDLFVYNQHKAQDIAMDMERIIGAVGKLVLPLPSEKPLRRLWCIWEWLCAHRAGVDIVIPEAAYDRHYFGKQREWFERSFQSMSLAQTSRDEDRVLILDAIVDTFGSVEQADAELRALADRSLTRAKDAPWRSARQGKGKGE